MPEDKPFMCSCGKGPLLVGNVCPECMERAVSAMTVSKARQQITAILEALERDEQTRVIGLGVKMVDVTTVHDEVKRFQKIVIIDIEATQNWS